MKIPDISSFGEGQAPKPPTGPFADSSSTDSEDEASPSTSTARPLSARDRKRARKLADAQRKKAKRQEETEEQRKKRLKSDAEQTALLRSQESVRASDARRRRDASDTAAARSLISDQQRDVVPDLVLQQKKLKEMTVDEKREYNRLKQRSVRIRKELSKSRTSLLSSVSRCSVVKADEPMEDVDEPHKSTPQKRQRSRISRTSKKSKNVSPPLPEQYHNVRIRVSWCDLFLVETMSYVVPHYPDDDSKSSIKNQFLKKFEVRADREGFEEVLKSDKWVESSSKFRPILHNTMAFADSIHVKAPACKPKKFTVASEANLRATYLSILHFCDSSKYKSVAMPILGRGISRKKSLAIALQVFNAYFQSVPSTNIELVYIVTRKEREYDSLGELMSFVREIDLALWNQSMMQSLIDMIYNKLKKTSTFSTMPGTDMCCRSLKRSYTSRKKREEQCAVQDIHSKMCLLTGIEFTPAIHIENAEKDAGTLPTQFIQQYDTGDYFAEIKNHKAFKIRAPIKYQCGSFAIKRKIWILANFYMFYSGQTQNQAAGLCDSDISYRRKLFFKLKPFHRGLAKEWNRIWRKAPYSCTCKMEHGFHENFVSFSTQMSHKDTVFKDWITKDTVFVHLTDDNDILDSLGVWLPRLTTEESSLEILQGSEFEWSEEFKVKVVKWFGELPQYLQNHCQNAQEVFETLRLQNYPTGNEQMDVNDEPFNRIEDYYQSLRSTECAEPALLQANEDLTKKRADLQNAYAEPEKVNELEMEVKKASWKVHSMQWSLHLQYLRRVEQMLRNRIFRRDSEEFEAIGPNIWKTEDEKYKPADVYLFDYAEGVFYEHSDSESDEEVFEVIDFPEQVDLGERKYPCKFCGALKFECQSGHSCCKSGQVWIDPIPKLPESVLELFQPKYRNYLIATNAAFSMASINYNRIAQAPHGVQSMKIKGLMSFHPSALHPRREGNNHYANFIVLDHGNAEIAQMRFETLRTGPIGLKDIFVQIQEYLQENNCLMDAFKNMYELELEAKDDGIQQSSLMFRIVPPEEVNQQFFREVERHPGVYAKPSTIGTGYISVAYSYNPDTEMQLPRGMTIYPKNPVGHHQKPISVFSENIDLMSYVTLHPDGVGGYQLHKHPRWTKKKNEVPTYEERKNIHIESLRDQGILPERYWDNVEDIGEHLEIAEETEMTEEQAHISSLSSAASDSSVFEFRGDQDEDENEDVLEELEVDNENMPVDDILEHGAHEDLQNAPIDLSIGQRPNIRTEEHGGQLYQVVVRENPMVDIPVLDDQALPFSDDSDEEDPRGYDKYQDPAEQYYQDYEADAENVPYHNEEATVEAPPSPEEIEYLMKGNSYRREDNDEDLDIGEDVCHGDEDHAESTALARRNDGIQNVGKRQFVSLAEYANFQMQPRRDIPNRYQGAAQTLGQLKTIDWAITDREMKMKVLTEKRAEYARAAPRSDVFKYYNKLVQDKVKGKMSLGMLVTMPSTVPGTSKYQRELVMSAITIANKLGHPDLFFTYTGNPAWPEIKRECARLKCQWPDIPEFVNTVFMEKAKIFLEDVCGKKVKSSKDKGRMVRLPGMFGAIRWYNYSIEFQQRGMPHMHLLVSLEEHILTADQIDNIVRADIPPMPDKDDPHYHKKLAYRNAVRDLMIHFPCEHDADAYCKAGCKPHWKTCKKGFPKPFSKHTIVSDSTYPTVKRTEGNTFTIKRGDQIVKAGSNFVVCHNMELLMKHMCHLNVEVVSGLRTVRYMFKYIHKGSDRVLLEATESVGTVDGRTVGGANAMTLQGNVIAPANVHPAVLQERQKTAQKMMSAAGVPTQRGNLLALNDCTYNQDLGAMTSCEAAWRLMHLPMHGSSHVVHRGYVHEEGNELIYFKRGLSAEEASQTLQSTTQTMLLAWFSANREPVLLPDGRLTTDLTFEEMFKFYVYNMKSRKFVYRKKDHSRHIIGRIQAPQPRFLELTATRILAQSTRGPKSFEELRTFKGVTYDTCLQAARARRLMTGQLEWHAVLQEVGTYEMPAQCRRVFASILIFCAPVNPRELFDDNKDMLLNVKPSWTEKQQVAHALRHVQFLLDDHGMSLEKFELDDAYIEADLPEHFEGDEDLDNPQRVIFHQNEHQSKGEAKYLQLNPAQKAFVDRAVHLATTPSSQPKILFLDGPGGTGKTFSYETVYHLLQGRGLKVTCVAHTGIAACLLPSGCTAHRKFSIPLEASDRMVCRVAKGSSEGDQIKNMDVLIWDESCMTDRRVLACVDRLLRDLRDEPDIPFGGALVIFGGDWRQILPIVEGVHGPGVIDYTIKRGELWKHVEEFKLTINQRASEDPEYSKFILAIGDGSNYVNKQRQQVHIPEKLVERGGELELIKWVFPTINDVATTKSASILTTDNRSALRLNEMIIDKLDGEVRELIAVDESDGDKGFVVDPETFASLCPQGMPPKVLKLKIGAQIVLLRNINVAEGLCNGTRLTVMKIGNDVLACKINGSERTTFLHRQRMSPKGKDAGFTRTQFPIRLAYACTINKAQGQTLSRVGLLLNTDPFAHGQLYVAMSRVRSSDCFRICHFKRRTSDDNYFTGGILVRNVVLKEALQ